MYSGLSMVLRIRLSLGLMSALALSSCNDKASKQPSPVAEIEKSGAALVEETKRAGCGGPCPDQGGLWIYDILFWDREGDEVRYNIGGDMRVRWAS
jgi:hypothetical protein